ncbi:MAG TPA: cupin domain-containing protein [Thermoleophilaceae bacterium]|jgi:quercetin dioxygenase-like cupin family protein
MPGDQLPGLAVRPGEGEARRNPIGGDFTFIARGAQTGGSLTALESVIPPGQGPPVHLHEDVDESIYLIDGDLRFKLGDELTDSPAGSYVFIPRGLPHAFRNPGDRPVRLLVTFTPAGMEAFFEHMATVTEFDPQEFRRMGAESGMQVLGPPLGG